MSRSRWTPLLVLVAAVAAWLAWRFLPREWLQDCCTGSGAATAGGSAARAEEEARATATPRPAHCAASTRNGQRCRREAEPGSIHCWQHGG